MVIPLEWSWFHSRNSDITQHKQMERCITSHKWPQVQKSPDHVIDEGKTYFIASFSCQLCKPESPGNRALPWGVAGTRLDCETCPSLIVDVRAPSPLWTVIPGQMCLGCVRTVAEQARVNTSVNSVLHGLCCMHPGSRSSFCSGFLCWWVILCLVKQPPLPRVGLGQHFITVTETKHKAFDKILHFFVINTLKILGVERLYLSMMKALYNQPTANIMINEENLEVFWKQKQDEDTHSYYFYSIYHLKS